MKALQELLFTIGDLVVIINVLALLTLFVFKVRNLSVMVSLLLLTITNGLMQIYGYFLVSKFGVWDPDFMRHAWYLSFALCYVVGAYILFQAHKQFKIKVTNVAKVISLSFFLLGSLQLIKYFVRVCLNIDIPELNTAYKCFVPAINIGVCAYTFISILKIKSINTQQV